jgi:hypothetical protein
MPGDLRMPAGRNTQQQRCDQAGKMHDATQYRI